MLKKVTFICIWFITFSCEQLIEVEDISNETVVVLAPVSNSVLEESSVNFSWEPVDFAKTYHLQIAYPNFEEAQTIVEDTIIESNNFNRLLEPNTYQWRVKAKNSAYETAFVTQNFTVEDE